MTFCDEKYFLRINVGGGFILLSMAEVIALWLILEFFLKVGERKK